MLIIITQNNYHLFFSLGKIIIIIIIHEYVNCEFPLYNLLLYCIFHWKNYINNYVFF